MAASTTLHTDDGLRIALKADGSIGAVAAGGKKLPLVGGGGFAIEEVIRPRGEVRRLATVVSSVTGSKAGARYSGAIPSAGLELKASIKGGKCIAVRGEVRDLTGMDRALRVKFTLPVNLRGWTWENTTATARKIGRGSREPSRKGDFLYLGIKGDGFADEIPDALPIRVNKLPFACVTRGKAALALALPIHEPRVFLIEAGETGLSITFSLGVTAATRKFPSRASFSFAIYPVDPAWGIRSACEKYHELYRELFRVRLNRHGNCGTLSVQRGLPTEDLTALGWAFQENDYQWTGGELPAEAAALARKHNLVSFHWRGPWYWFHKAPGEITPDEQMALLKAQAEGRAKGAHGINNQLCGCPDRISAKGGYNSHLVSSEGKLERVYFAYPKYGCWLLPMNMDPNLPEPNRGSLARDWQYRYRKLWKRKSFRGPRNVAYDALDDFSGHRRLNFRRSHIAVMDVPATFDPESGHLCQIKGFGDWAWARDHGKLVHRDGGKIMANCNIEYAMMFCGPYIDVIFRERRLADNDEEQLSTHRMLLGAKPICFIGGGREPKEARRWKAMADRALLFGMSPGESRLHDELREHMPVMQKVAAAGWQAVPHARARGLWVERFGNKPGKLYFTVRNCGKSTRRTTLKIDLTALGLSGKRLGLEGLNGAEPGKPTIRGGRLTTRLSVKPERTAVLVLKQR
jgi:hypothetical protein